jgi:ribosomal protein S21
VTQAIPRAREWFNKPMRARKRKIADELGDAMHRIAKRIT